MLKRELVYEVALWLMIATTVGIGATMCWRETSQYRRSFAQRETALLMASDVIDRNHDGLLQPEEKLDAFSRCWYDTRRFDIKDVPDISILSTVQLERLVRSYEMDGIYPNYGSW